MISSSVALFIFRIEKKKNYLFPAINVSFTGMERSLAWEGNRSIFFCFYHDRVYQSKIRCIDAESRAELGGH